LLLNRTTKVDSSVEALINGPCHVSGIFLPFRVKSLPLATIYEVKIPLRKWKKSLLQRNPAQMTSAIVSAKLQEFEFPAAFSPFVVEHECGAKFKILEICRRKSYRGFPIKFRGCEPKNNFFNKCGNLNFWCLGEGQVSYLPIDQKFIGVVSSETEI
jgi:hypothetical protein